MKTRISSETSSEMNQRVISSRDWYFLANMSHSQTWEIMLKTREKLKEYSSNPLETVV